MNFDKQPPEGKPAPESLKKALLERVNARKGYWPVKKPKGKRK